MSEAELHILKARMLAGRQAKARRGELGKPLPMGYRAPPFRRSGVRPRRASTRRDPPGVRVCSNGLRTVGKVLCYLVEHDIRMPVRTPGGPRQGRAGMAPRQPAVAARSVRQSDLRRRLRLWRPSDRSAAAEAGTAGHRAAVRRVPEKPRCSCRIGCRPTSPASSSSAIRRRSAPTGRSSSARSGPAVRCCRADGLRSVRVAHDGAYNNDGHAARYVCIGMHTTYGEPFCQSLKADARRRASNAPDPASTGAGGDGGHLGGCRRSASRARRCGPPLASAAGTGAIPGRSGPPPLRQHRA